jgi:hypothetical protein
LKDNSRERIASGYKYRIGYAQLVHAKVRLLSELTSDLYGEEYSMQLNQETFKVFLMGVHAPTILDGAPILWKLIN